MSDILRWDLEQKKYVPFSPPQNCQFGFSIVPFGDDLAINWAKCGAVIASKTAYTSYLIQNEDGFGYCICGDCLTKEIQERKDSYAAEKRRQ